MELHPAILHFPIALSLVAALLLLLSRLIQNDALLTETLGGVNGDHRGRMIFTEGVKVDSPEARCRPAQDNTAKAGHLSEIGEIPKRDSHTEVED